MDVNPDHPKAGQLRSWYDAGGKTEDVQVLSAAWAELAPSAEEATDLPPFDKSKTKPRTVVAAMHSGSFAGGRSRTFTTATMGRCIRLPYGSHDGRKCQKKMRQNEMNGMWECERHYDTVIPSVDWRYLCTVKLADYSGAVMASVFGEVGEKLFGMR